MNDATRFIEGAFCGAVLGTLVWVAIWIWLA
jgi:hypothetical protein